MVSSLILFDVTAWSALMFISVVILSILLAATVFLSKIANLRKMGLKAVDLAEILKIRRNDFSKTQIVVWLDCRGNQS